jgi:hypothetical protein
VSVRLMGAIFDLDISAPEKLVLLAMADHAQDDGTKCWPSISRIAEKSSTTPRGVQKIIRRLERAGFLKHIGRHPKGTNEYQIILARGEHGSVGEPGSGVNLETKRGERGSPESLRTVKRKTPRTQRPEKTVSDPRFQPILDSYFKGMRARAIEPTPGAADYRALRDWLRTASPEKMPRDAILRTLDNALNSTETFPLRPGFRLRDFVAHQASFQVGPLLKAPIRSAGPIADGSRPNHSPRLSDADAAHMGVAR